VPDEAALIEDIVADPDDDRPRLVYADLLQQQGKPLGEFIAVQCELARARAADDDKRATKLAKRERKLLDENELRWVFTARELLPRAMQFRRGFLEVVRLEDAQELAKAMPRLRPHAPVLRAIEARGRIGAVGHWDLWQIDEVIAHAAIHGDDVKAIAYAERSRLRKLSCLGGGMGDAALVGLVELPQPLVRLEFCLDARPTKRMPILTRLAAAPAREGLQELRVRMPASTADVVAAVARLRGLHTLGVVEHDPDRVAITALVSAVPSLSSFELDRGRGDQLDLAAIVRALPKLRHLRLANLGLTDRQVTALAELPELAQLVRLDLRGNQLAGPGLVAIAESPHAINVRKLWIGGNPLVEPHKAALRESPLADRAQITVR
jgi:uncharacterized protein (TIGR02996 family)